VLQLNKGIDILGEVGGITTLEQAEAVFGSTCDAETRVKLGRITNRGALVRIANAIAMTGPASVFVHTGSREDARRVRLMALAGKEESWLGLPDHTIHFDLAEEQARIIDRTFYVVNPDETVSELARSVGREEALAYVRESMGGIAGGRALFVGFFSRGPIGAVAAIPALQITTSAYVMHSADILYRHAYRDFDAETERAGCFFTNVHSEGPNRPEDLPRARVFMDRSWLTTYAVFCTYAGNTLLLKKGNHRFAVDLATYRDTGRVLSEHMFITGLTNSAGRTTYFAGAAPSGCGKTTTAMVGTDFIGDDLAQMWIAEDGTLRAINPEVGVFGIVRDVSRASDPYLMGPLREQGSEVIWSNVLVDVAGVPHWVGSGEPVPERGVNFQGEWWPGKTDPAGGEIPPSHPNSRFTLRNTAIANYNPAAAEDPRGVRIHVITYSGRDADTMPPVWVATSPDEGVAIGASVLSAATATEIGASGVRRQPWANEPFIPGSLSDYLAAQIAFFNSEHLTHQPLMAGLNYFLTAGARGGVGKALLGEKRDVKVWLGWLERRAHGEVEAIRTPIGHLPAYEDLAELFRGIGKEYPPGLYDRQFALYVDNILARIHLLEQAYSQDPNVSRRLLAVYRAQTAGLEALKSEHGPVVSVSRLGG
jgi:phosphoenolpyruvate carboxykinase (GTP)